MSGHPLLVEAAVHAISEWRYEQCFVNGVPVETGTRIRITFKLDTDGSPQISANYTTDDNQLAQSEPNSASLNTSDDEAEEEIYGPDEVGLRPPRLISGADPYYPRAARKAGIQGAVTLMCVITSTGTVRDIIVVDSLDPMLDEEAIEAVKKWKFKPAKKDGRPVSVKVRIPVNFRLY
jgi:TonB family protein